MIRRSAAFVICAYFTSARLAQPVDSVSAFTKTKAGCATIKNYTAWQAEVVDNYSKKLPKLVDNYLPGKVKDNNAAYLFVNPKAWADLSPKLQIELTHAAYMVEVCNPKTSEWPTLMIADWKTMKPIGTRNAGAIGGWFGK